VVARYAQRARVRARRQEAAGVEADAHRRAIAGCCRAVAGRGTQPAVVLWRGARALADGPDEIGATRVANRQVLRLDRIGNLVLDQAVRLDFDDWIVDTGQAGVVNLSVPVPVACVRIIVAPAHLDIGQARVGREVDRDRLAGQRAEATMVLV